MKLHVRSAYTISCPFCQSPAKRNGYHSSGIRRYRCTVCYKSFIRSSRSPVIEKDFMDFSLFVRGRVNRVQILSAGNKSRPTLSVRFGNFLDHPLSAKDVWHILPPATVTSNTPIWYCKEETDLPLF